MRMPLLVREVPPNYEFENLIHIGKLDKFTPGGTAFARDGVYERYIRENPETSLQQKSFGIPVGKMTLHNAYKNMAKWDQPHPTFTEYDEYKWNVAKRLLKEMFLPYVAGSGMVLPSFRVLIARMNLDSSLGFPYNAFYEDKYQFLDDWYDELEDEYNTQLKLLRAGKYSAFPSTCVLKDEKRAQEKLDEDSIRAFICSNVVSSLLQNTFVNEFNEAFYASKFKTWSAVSVNKFYCGWDDVYRRMARFPHCYEIDFKQWDSRMFTKIFEAIVELRVDASNGNHERELRQLYNEICHTNVIMPDGHIYQKNGGNNSGQSSTVVDNTLGVILMLLFYIVNRYEDLTELDDIKKHFVAIANGDDLNISTDFDFDLKDFQKFCTRFNMRMTTEIYEPRDAGEITFLSQGFFNYKGIYIPKPDSDKIISILEYADHDYSPELSLVRATAALRESLAYKWLLDEIYAYCGWIVKTYDEELQGRALWENAKKTIIPLREIEKQYITTEL